MNVKLSTVESAAADASEQVARTSSTGWSDWAGMVASVGCAIHCAAMPFVIAYLPALGLTFLADEAFHQWMAVGCFAIALTAFIPGLRRHKRLTPVVIGSVGLTLISVAAFGFAGECCPDCESSSDAIVASTEVGAVVDDADAAGCTDSTCPHCANAAAVEKGNDVVASRDAAANSDGAVSLASFVPAELPSDLIDSSGGSEAVPSTSSRLTSLIAPWLTPIGGMVLVTAHLLNRRYGCLCGCCENEPVTELA